MVVTMPQTETRHAEKSTLFKLMVVKYNGDVEMQIAHQRATMEKEDISDVEREFEAWKSNQTPVIRKP
jgi:hypothetical protein